MAETLALASSPIEQPHIANVAAQPQKQAAHEQLGLTLDSIAASPETITDKSHVIQAMTGLLRGITGGDLAPDEVQTLSHDQHLNALKIFSPRLVQNSLDRQLHGRIIDYMRANGQEVSDTDLAEMRQLFNAQDMLDKESALSSYATNGILTLSSIKRFGIATRGSATPGDTIGGDTSELSEEVPSAIRGYIVDNPKDTDVFHGNNGFLKVALEREGEDIDRLQALPKEEIDNRLQNSVMFVVNPSRLNLTSRDQNVYHEDIVSEDIPPEAIDFVLVDKANLELAQKMFQDLPASVVGVDRTDVQINMLYNGDQQAPDYESTIKAIVEQNGPQWCHIARLPVDTYPRDRAKDSLDLI